MRSRFLFVLLTLCAVHSLFAQSNDPLQPQIESLKGKIVTLRHFYSDNELHYSSDGTLLSRSGVGPWTLTGRMAIEKVSIKDDYVQLEGRRAWVIFHDRDQINGLTVIPVSLKVDVVGGPERLKKWEEALPRIFFTMSAPISDDAPAYWKAYLSPPEQAPKPNPVDSAREGRGGPASPDLHSPHTPTRVRVNQGVMDGAFIHKEVPQYLPEARAAHVQGQVVLHAIIGKDGHVKDLQVASSVGAGLDDEAAKAVQRWVYRPYYLKGNPVELDTQITINFELAR